MDPVMTLVIAAIVAAIVLVMFNKQQANKVSNNMYADDVQQLYLLTAAEYKINVLENQQHQRLNQNDDTASTDISGELTRLTTAFNNGEIQLKEFNNKLDYLLTELDINTMNLAQVC
jgi:uncharacterized protein HemX